MGGFRKAEPTFCLSVQLEDFKRMSSKSSYLCSLSEHGQGRGYFEAGLVVWALRANNEATVCTSSLMLVGLLFFPGSCGCHPEPLSIFWKRARDSTLGPERRRKERFRRTSPSAFYFIFLFFSIWVTLRISCLLSCFFFSKE